MGGRKVYVGLDVGSYAVKAVALQANKDRLSLLGYAQMRVEEQEPSVVIRRVIDMLGVRPRNLITAVSGRSVIVRQVETPKLQDAELKAHIAYEADKYIPFGADEVVLDCQPLPAAGEEEINSQQVLLVAVRRGFVEDHVSMLQSAGLTPMVIDVDVFALCNCFWTLGPLTGGAPSPDPEAPPSGGTAETIALVDIGASKSWVSIVKGNRPLFQREIYLAGNEVTDAIVRAFNEEPEDIEAIKLAPDSEALEALLDAAMPAFEDLANEVRLSFDYVEGQFEEDVTRVILTGGSSLLPGLPEVLGNILGRPVEVFDPLGGIDLIPSKYDLHGLDANAPSLSIALGLACHAAADDAMHRGLGGAQIATWSPRRGGVSATQPAAMPEEDYAGSAATAPPPPEAPPEPSPAMGAPPQPSEPLAFPTPPPDATPAPPPIEVPHASVPELQPPPDADAPPAYELPEQPASSVDEALGALIGESNADLPVADAADDYDSGQNRSSMLVILDDEDDEMLGTEDNLQPPPPQQDDGGLPPLPG